MIRKVALALGFGVAIALAFATGGPGNLAAARTVPDRSSVQAQQSDVTAPTDAPESPAAPLLVIVPSAIVGAVWAARRQRAPPG